MIFIITRGVAFWIISGFEVFNLTDGKAFKAHLVYISFVLLFMIPAYMCTSVYMLLWLCFIEIVIFSREQTVVSTRWFRKLWQICFYTTNVVLYTAQGISYSLVFIFGTSDKGDQMIENIFETLWLLEMILPCLAGIVHIYILCRYAGFPFIDTLAKLRHKKITRVFAVWSLASILSGMSLLLSTNKSWTNEIDEIYVQMYVVAVAMLTEGLPCLMILDWKIVRFLQRERQSFAHYDYEACSDSQALATREGYVEFDEDEEREEWVEIPKTDLTVDTSVKLDEMGHTLFSTYTGKYKLEDVVVKQFNTQSLTKDANREMVNACMNSLIFHPNLNQFFGVSWNKNSFAMVSKYWKRLSLYDIILASPRDVAFAQHIICRIGIQISEALEYLHSRGQTHGYLKSRNVILDSNMNVKVTDYNLQPLKAYAQVMIPDTMLDGYWTDPAFFLGKAITPKSDVYAFGYLLWEMYTKEVPFEDLKLSQLIKTVQRGTRPDIPTTVPDFIRNLMFSCWETSPHKRPTFTEISAVLRAGSTTPPPRVPLDKPGESRNTSPAGAPSYSSWGVGGDRDIP